MIEYALDASEWGPGKPWYYGQRLLRQILGFGSEALLDQNPTFKDLIAAMGQHYERWAHEHLSRDDDNVTSLCHFLASATGRALRMKGLGWLPQAVTTEAWYRPAMGNALLEFLNVTLTQDGPQLRSDTSARDAFLALVALLVSKQVPAALALQERAQIVLTSGELCAHVQGRHAQGACRQISVGAGWNLRAAGGDSNFPTESGSATSSYRRAQCRSSTGLRAEPTQHRRGASDRDESSLYYAPDQASRRRGRPPCQRSQPAPKAALS